MTTKLKQALTKVSPQARRQVRILTLDVETKPNAAFTWGMFRQNISLQQLIETSEVMCFAAKWYGQAQVHFHADWEDGGKEGMVQAAHDLVSEADIIVHFNGASFDMPNLHREFLLAGLPQPRPYKNVDLLQTVRKQFRFTSNKLDHVAQELGIGAKTPHAGFQLWVECMAGDPKAQKKMEQYNRQDVRLTEKLYDRLRGWIPNHPHLSLYTNTPNACPNCGHVLDVAGFEGIARTPAQTYAAGQCPKCGHWVRGTERLSKPTNTRSVR